MAASSAGPLAFVRAALDSFWYCRVSLLSVLAGWLILYAAPQAQSLFLELQTYQVGLQHWGGFYLAVFLFWMLPTQFSARVMLHAGEARMNGGPSRWYGLLLVQLPWLLALMCLVGVAAGQFWTFSHIPDDLATPAMEFEKAAYQQLMLLLVTTICLIVLWVLAWLVLPPFLNRLTASTGLLDIWVFRLIAAIMFGRRAVPSLSGDGARQENGGDRFTPEQLQTAWSAVALFLIWGASIYFVFLSPLESKSWLDRAPMIPILVGAWVPVLTFFAYFAHRLRLPLLALFVVLMTALGNFLPNLHGMRVLRQSPATGPVEARQPTLKQAILWWRKANGCEPDFTKDCAVRPIIVAAEGGASRAAFFTASLLAHLEDLTSGSGAAAGQPPFSRQLFAISTVSGGSLGAAVYAALLDQYGSGAWPRLRPEGADDAQWFRSGKAYGLRGLSREPLPGVMSRKDVVQQILAGDFLSPAIAALSLDIWVPFHVNLINPGDRTYFLERSWEERFADPSGGTKIAGLRSLSPRTTGGQAYRATGLERGLASLAPDETTWRPLLVFNGTSITTGRRIITSTLHPLMGSPDDPDDLPDDQRTVEAVFRDAYDTYDLMCSSTLPPGPGDCACVQPAKKTVPEVVRIKGCDVRLSTAVSNAARFPVVSSHGDITTTGG